MPTLIASLAIPSLLILNPSVRTSIASYEYALGKAPPPLEWRSDVPQPELRGDGSVILPPVLAGEIVRHLRYGDEYPKLCQSALDAQAAALNDSLKSKQAELDEAESQRGAPFWVLVLGFAAGAVGGVVIGVNAAR